MKRKAVRNPVARCARKVNSAKIHVDQKKAVKRGARKHRKAWSDSKAA